MIVREIIKEYLSTNGFDGLVNDTGDCGCEIEDLWPCGEDICDCEPGYKIKCDCREECGWHIATPDAIKISVVGKLLALVGIDLE